MIVHFHSYRTFVKGTVLGSLFIWTGIVSAQTSDVSGTVSNAKVRSTLEGITSHVWQASERKTIPAPFRPNPL